MNPNATATTPSRVPGRRWAPGLTSLAVAQRGRASLFPDAAACEGWSLRRTGRWLATRDAWYQPAPSFMVNKHA